MEAFLHPYINAARSIGGQSGAKRGCRPGPARKRSLLEEKGEENDTAVCRTQHKGEAPS